MKVLLASNHHGALAGGAVAMIRVTEELLRSAGHDTVTFAIREDANFDSRSRAYFPSIGDLRRQPLPSDDSGASPYSIPARVRVLRLVRAERPDVAHLHNVFGKLTLSVVDALHSESIPIVLTLHEYKSVCPNGVLYTHDGVCHRCVRGGRFWNAVRHRCLDRSVYKSAIAAAEAYLNRWRGVWDKIDLFVAPSEFLRDAVVAGGLPRDRIEVVPNPAPALSDPRDRRIDGQTFVYSGRLIPQKGLDVLLDAVNLTKANVRLVLFGSGPLDRYLRQRVERERLPVEIRGYADNQTIARELDGCVASVTPSLWYENCPMAILEAAGRGVATIAGDLGAMPELVEHKETGLVVSPGDARGLASALDEVAADPAWAAQLGRAAWERVRARHDPQRYVVRILDLYERALGRHRCSGR